jgi:hypothetical protein
VQAFIGHAGLEGDVGRRLDAHRATVPGVCKAVRTALHGSRYGWFLSFHCFTKYIKVGFFAARGCVGPPGDSSREVRYLDIHEDDPLDESRWHRGSVRRPPSRAGMGSS